MGSVRVPPRGTFPCTLHFHTHTLYSPMHPVLSDAPYTPDPRSMHLALSRAPCTRTWHPALSLASRRGKCRSRCHTSADAHACTRGLAAGACGSLALAWGTAAMDWDVHCLLRADAGCGACAHVHGPAPCEFQSAPYWGLAWRMAHKANFSHATFISKPVGNSLLCNTIHHGTVCYTAVHCGTLYTTVHYCIT